MVYDFLQDNICRISLVMYHNFLQVILPGFKVKVYGLELVQIDFFYYPGITNECRFQAISFYFELHGIIPVEISQGSNGCAFQHDIYKRDGFPGLYVLYMAHYFGHLAKGRSD